MEDKLSFTTKLKFNGIDLTASLSPLVNWSVIFMGIISNFRRLFLLRSARLAIDSQWNHEAFRENPATSEDLVGFVYDQVTTDLILTPSYEVDFINAWLSFLRDKNFKFDLFIDGGAHIGMTSLAVSSHFRTVHAFEPMDLTFEMLKLNTRHTKNIILKNLALYNEKTTKELSYGKGFVSGASLDQVGTEVISKKIFTTTLDTELKGVKFDSLVIKLDIEGSEFNALLGAQKLIKNHRPVFIIEVLRRKIDNGSSDAFGFLKNEGYKFYNPEIQYRGKNKFRKLFNKNSKIIVKPIDQLEREFGLYNYLICMP